MRSNSRPNGLEALVSCGGEDFWRSGPAARPTRRRTGVGMKPAVPPGQLSSTPDRQQFCCWMVNGQPQQLAPPRQAATDFYRIEEARVGLTAAHTRLRPPVDHRHDRQPVRSPAPGSSRCHTQTSSRSEDPGGAPKAAVPESSMEDGARRPRRRGDPQPRAPAAAKAAAETYR